MASNQGALAIARAIELNEAMKPKKTLSLRTLAIGTILKVLGFKSVISQDGNQIIGTFKTEDRETVKIDVTAVFADKENLKEKEVNDIYMVYKGLNANDQEQVIFIATREKAMHAVPKSSMNEKYTHRDASPVSSEYDSETDAKDIQTKNNLKMNIRMW
jgi:hypothetical protein